MNSLQKMFPSLTLFSDLNWEAVTEEYERDYIDLAFPEYLQQKSLDGDCPPYLFELAFYELALYDAKTSIEPFPHQSGIFLNPTALFLSLEFDVSKMLEQALSGNIEIIERPHVLCLFRDTHDKLHTMELSEEALELLQFLEDGPQSDREFVQDEIQFNELKKTGLIIENL
ncbi:hypothetical protein ACJVC5_10615 [Peredibacter sp. HCB2-198]|uniref:HvfC family peptide modification chaperone n=1 Tax=Peredibacter sp. HCB2-198 TaxID=3383025 RepID=UPI0038B45411